MPQFNGQNKKRVNPRYFLLEQAPTPEQQVARANAPVKPHGEERAKVVARQAGIITADPRLVSFVAKKPENERIDVLWSAIIKRYPKLVRMSKGRGDVVVGDPWPAWQAAAAPATAPATAPAPAGTGAGAGAPTGPGKTAKAAQQWGAGDPCIQACKGETNMAVCMKRCKSKVATQQGGAKKVVTQQR